MEFSLFFLDNQTTHHPIDNGITRQVMGSSDSITMAKVTFLSGSSAQVHSHDAHDQSSYVAGGRFEIMVGEKSYTLSAGDGFFVPRGTPHNATCIEDGVLVDTFSPGRVDML